MKFITAEQLDDLLDFPTLIAGLQRFHRQNVDALRDLLIEQPSSGGSTSCFFLRAAWQREQALGAKIITVFPDNPSSGKDLPTIQAVYLLFDGTTGTPRAVIDGTALTAWKTAGDSALGAKFLAREDCETMLMVGAGAMAAPLIRAHTAIRPSLQRVRVWNRHQARAQALCESLRLDGIDVGAAADLEGAARKADLISCATAATSPLLKGEWLKPGTHVDLVGGFTPRTREADDEVMRRGRLFVDSRDTTLNDVGDLIEPIKSGVITADDVLADHFQLSRGERRGRESSDEITVFKNGGGGHLDLMTARLAVELAGA